MPTPIGPAPRDPKDPDLWHEWYEEEDEHLARRRFGWPMRWVALLIAVAIATVLILAT